MWQTLVTIEKPDFVLDYASRMMLVGSCFAENMGNKLRENRFAVDINPCGIAYNPESVAQTVKRLIENRLVTENELIWNKGKWVSLFHHGSFSAVDKEECLERINKRIRQGAEQLKNADLLMLTWGTSWVYRYKATGNIVSNCHRFPADEFERYRLSVSEITETYDCLLKQLKQFNPALKVLFTISPIRHWKDGAHGNQLSKSVLLLAIDELLQRWQGVYYFPSYEIVLDELRDYRFYADDMLHISETTVEYLWTRFKETFLSSEALLVMKRIEYINKGLGHRPFDETNQDYVAFQNRLLDELEQLRSKYPLITR
ncbi:GSCFA domain-containing protein [Odoribacter lunatus]|uniref:GSCFA domain-containing protein n=1 Tax=Odoribacter lunatus TaxID=2941335 RepID=UPI0020426CB7|nr:GSCFA domain-containing protein [Odoribacter lunatus]